MLDNLDDKFDGTTQSFTLTENGGDVVSIRSGEGSNINVQDIIIIFINDILQVPGEGYKFEGGSVIEFTEAPKSGDTSKLIFYKGSGDQDVVFKDIIETVKVGDDLTIGHSPSTEPFKGVLDMDQEGYIIAQNPGTSITNIEGVFAAGDCVDKIYRQAVTAAGMGCMAALDAEKWMQNQ